MAEAGTTVRPGRPRSAETEQAILDATLELLVENGFGGMSVEGMASRAGVGKAAIYRRWSNKEEVVVEALRNHAARSIPLLDSGDLRADLLGMLDAMRNFLTGADGPIMTAFVSEKARFPSLRAEFDRAFVSERREHVRRIVSDAVDRGDLPDTTDVELLADAGAAILFHRTIVLGQDLDASLPARIIDLLLGPAPA